MACARGYGCRMPTGFRARETAIDDRLAPRSPAARVSRASAPTGGLTLDGVQSLQRTAGNAAVAGLLQRNGGSATLLKELAEPKVLEFEAKQVAVQTEIVNRLESTIAANTKAPAAHRVLEKAIEKRAKQQNKLLEPYLEEGADEPSEAFMQEIQLGIAALNAERESLSAARATQRDRDGRWNEQVIPIGAIELTSLPDDDAALLKTARLTDLMPNSLNQPSAFDLVETAGVKDQVVQNTLNTMLRAGQIDYLRKSKMIGPEWMVLVEIHYYRRRAQNVSQFHKDTLGQTLFVNLNYQTPHEIAGPEYLQNPATAAEHEQQIKETLPSEFLADLAETRKGAKEPTEIMAPIIPAYGAVAFVDEAIHHMTPLRGHREVKSSDFAKYLQDTYPEHGPRRRPPPEKWDLWLAMSRAPDAKYTRRDLGRAGMRRSEIDALLTLHGGSGFQTVSIPGMKEKSVPLERRSKAPLKRRMSERALKKTGTPGGLPPAVSGERRFFRTWVRAVRRKQVAQ